MDPSRKRRIRLTVALTAAVVLASALVYTSFSDSAESLSPTRLMASARPGQNYQLTGKVAGGYTREGDTLNFRVHDRTGSASVPVSYTGEVPDPFKTGREVIVTVHKQGAGFVATRDSLITKCPSKYQTSSSTPT